MGIFLTTIEKDTKITISSDILEKLFYHFPVTEHGLVVKSAQIVYKETYIISADQTFGSPNQKF